MSESSNFEPVAPPPPDQPPQQGFAGTALPYFLALAVLFVMAYGAFKWWQVQQWQLMRGEAVPISTIGPPLTEFELMERSGKPFRSTEMRGKVWVVTYFFTTCPGSCIRLNQAIKMMHDQPDLKDVTWVSITCDPENDTTEALQKYADQFQADPDRWLFLRGDLDYIKRVGLGMKMDVYRQGHKDYAIVIDKAGKIRGMYNATSQSDLVNLRKRLLEVLAETPPSELAAAPAAETSR
jgi:protein SCO1/2